jgi:hypothetical protein
LIRIWRSVIDVRRDLTGVRRNVIDIRRNLTGVCRNVIDIRRNLINVHRKPLSRSSKALIHWGRKRFRNL